MGAIYACSYGFALAIVAMHYPLCIVLALLAHDLRSPLGMADSTMQLLQSKADALTEDQRVELLEARPHRHPHRRPRGPGGPADPARLQQVVVNLVHNAMKYGAAPIVVGTSQEGELVQCWVRDHGNGVPRELAGRIFSRFGAGDAADAVGLGLWIVERLVHAHGGEIEHEDADPGRAFHLAPARSRPPPTQRDDVSDS